MIKITNDVMDIASRIKEIDERYEVYYNPKTSKFEVHTGDVRQAIIPYASLDARAEFYLRRTRRENIDRLTKELDEENRRLSEARDKRVLDNAINNLDNALR